MLSTTYRAKSRREELEKGQQTGQLSSGRNEFRKQGTSAMEEGKDKRRFIGPEGGPVEER